MRHIRITTIFFLSFLFFQICSAQLTNQSDLRAGKKGSSYPPFVLKNDNSQISLDSIKGKVTWMNFWFEACKPCMAEMEGIREIYEKYEKHPDFVFLSLTWENKETIDRVRTKFPMPYYAFSVSDTEAERLNGMRGYPTNIIIGKDGTILYVGIGGKTVPAEARLDLMNKIVPVIEEGLNK
jgi:thiol-disulfide isomerase/thioredoxin